MSSDGRYRGAKDKEGKPNPFVDVVTTGRHSQPGTGRHGPLGQGTGRHSQPGTGRQGGVVQQTTGAQRVSSPGGTGPKAAREAPREAPREGPRRSDPRSDDFDERNAPLTEPAPPPSEFDEIEAEAHVSLEPDPLGPITDPSPAPVPSASVPAASVPAASVPEASIPAASSVAQQTGAVNVALVSARAAAAEPSPDLAPELMARLRDAAELHAALRSMNHYQLLGVSSQASLREVRSAYFGLSKRFHPDAFFRKEIGGYRAKLESVFDALTRAYEALRKSGARSEYDDSIALPQALRAPPESTRSSLPPGARIESEFDRVQREVERRTPSMVPPGTNAVPPAPPGPPPGAPLRAAGAGREVPAPANTNAPRPAIPVSPRPSKPTPKPRSSRPPVRGTASDRARSASDRARPTATSDRARSAHNPPPPRQMQEMGPSTRSMSLPSSVRDPSARPDTVETRSGTGPRPSLQGSRPGSVRPSAAGARAPSSPGAQTGTVPNPFDESERRSTQLRELDRLMQQRLSQSSANTPARPSVPPAAVSGPGTGNFSAPGTGNFSAPGTGSFTTPGTGNLSSPGTGTFGSPGTGSTGTAAGAASLAPDGAAASRPPHAGPSLLELAEQLAGGTGLANWASQRLREAYHEEQAGHVVDAANIVRIVLNQYKDAQVEAHSQRLSRLVAAKTAPAQKMRARAAEKDGLWKEAAECWAKVREGCPSDGQAAYHHARTLMQAGDLKNAGRAAMRAAELVPEHVETRELLIEFFEKMGMKLNARRERDTVQKLLEAKAKAPPPPPAKK